MRSKKEVKERLELVKKGNEENKTLCNQGLMKWDYYEKQLHTQWALEWVLGEE